MTRKRFVKKMMGLGYSRNEANRLADRAIRYGSSYVDRWRYEISPWGALVRGMMLCGGAFRRMGRAVRQLCGNKPPDGLRTHIVIADEWAYLPGKKG